MTVIIAARHGAVTPEKKSASVDTTRRWPLSPEGVEQTKLLGRALVDTGLVSPGENRSKLELITGDQRRLRHTMYHLTGEMGSFVQGLEVYRESYLNGRIKNGLDALTDDPFLEKSQVTEESFAEFLRRGPERFVDRVRRRSGEATHFLLSTTREFILGLRVRFKGPGREETSRALSTLSHSGQLPKHPHDVMTGEAVCFADIHPGTQEGIPGKFRWERVINPSIPQRSTDWYPIKVRTYTREELMSEELWGDD